MTTEKNPLLEKIEKEKVTNTQLLLPTAPSKITEEVEKEISKFEDFGIKNKSYDYLAEKTNEIKKEESDLVKNNAKAKVLQELSKILFPFNIVSYSTMDQIARNYGFIIAPLNWYKEAIPDENLEELSIFKDKFKDLVLEEEKQKEEQSWKLKPKNLSTFIKFFKSYSFNFLNDFSSRKACDNLFEEIEDVDFSGVFNILAPADHFEIKKNTLRIGNEIKPSQIKKPKFAWDNLKVASFPRPTITDPIIFPSFTFNNNTYCIVVTAWDKVADDSRIRSLI